MLPASGACTPKTTWPSGLRPSASLKQTVLDHAQAEAPELDRVVRRPQPHLADLVLGPRHAGLQRRRVTVQHLTLERDDLGVHERPDHLEDGLHLFGHVEVHGE